MIRAMFFRLPRISFNDANVHSKAKPLLDTTYGTFSTVLLIGLGNSGHL